MSWREEVAHPGERKNCERPGSLQSRVALTWGGEYCGRDSFRDSRSLILDRCSLDTVSGGW